MKADYRLLPRLLLPIFVLGSSAVRAAADSAAEGDSSTSQPTATTDTVIPSDEAAQPLPGSWQKVGSTIVPGSPESVTENRVKVDIAAASGDRVLVSLMEREDDESGGGDFWFPGKIFVYELKSSGDGGRDWELAGSPIELGDRPQYWRIGAAMSANGDRIIVGGTAIPPRVFRWDAAAGDWTQLGDGALSEYSAEKVAISEDGVHVAFVEGSDVVRVLEYTNGKWVPGGSSLLTTYTASYPGLCFDISILPGRNLLITGTVNGVVDVFEKDPKSGTGEQWDRTDTVGTPPGGSSILDTSWYGYSCDIASAGNTFAVGGPKFGSGLGNSREGLVDVYTKAGESQWDQTSSIVGEPGDNLGNSLAISAGGMRIAVAQGLSAVVKAFHYVGPTNNSTSGWQQLGDSISGIFYPLFGSASVAMSGDGSRIVVGQTNTNGGAVEVFDCIGCPSLPATANSGSTSTSTSTSSAVTLTLILPAAFPALLTLFLLIIFLK